MIWRMGFISLDTGSRCRTQCNTLPNIILCLSHNMLLGSLLRAHNSSLVYLNLFILAK